MLNFPWVLLFQSLLMPQVLDKARKVLLNCPSDIPASAKTSLATVFLANPVKKTSISACMIFQMPSSREDF